ncbi:MAG: hypothetical protein ACREV8_07665, partial [Gammaproteobacteria bacterium]
MSGNTLLALRKELDGALLGPIAIQIGEAASVIQPAAAAIIVQLPVLGGIAARNLMAGPQNGIVCV